MLSNERFREFVIKRVEDVHVVLENSPEYQRLARAETEMGCRIDDAAKAPIELRGKRTNANCYIQGWRGALRTMLQD